MERDIEREENPLLKYVREIDKLSKTTEEEKLKKVIEETLNHLPQNVRSLSIPVGDSVSVTAQRECADIPEEEQRDWSLGDLIAYSVSESGLTNETGD
ncbi:MAG TPA: hypothetical protein PK432_00200 [Candidatus Dojkabacteria bacterium]|jgi:hypothetical protein|nr:hypothetical protein [Candidatus Dojkabacteria bacterium]HPP18806.1 hypothetical protein [Candidatus Dojkabacteria bacterium]